MPLAQLIDTSEAHYQVPVGLIDEEVEHAAQGIHCHGGTITGDAFIVPLCPWSYAAGGLREIRHGEVEHTAQEIDRKGGAATVDAFVIRGCSWLYEAARRLRELRNLASNWDSYGSPPLNEVVFASAKEFLFSLRRDAPSPAIVPVSGGGVQFEWQVNGRELEIEFCPDGRIEYLKVSEDETMDEGEIPPMKAMRSHALLTWLLEGQQICDMS